MPPKNDFVIRTHAPARQRLLLATLVLLALAGGYALFSWGSIEARAALDAAARAVAVKDELASALETRVKALGAETARLQRQLSVDASAREALVQDLHRQREKLGRLREEVAFFRTLALPADEGRTASTLIEFRLYHPSATPRRFRFSVWLARLQPGGEHTSAELVVKVLGRRGEQTLELEAAELGGGAKIENFSFQHFRRLDGVLTLPPEFEPEAVALELSLLGESSKDDRLVRMFPWTVPQA